MVSVTGSNPRLRVDAMSLAGVGLLLLFAFQIFRGWAGSGEVPEVVAPAGQQTATQVGVADASAAGARGEPAGVTDLAWHTAVAAPYDTYYLTQGLHGQSYGHLAIDIASGKGSTIKSLINGTVTDVTTDQWGNTILVIDNDRYQVTLYHGDYTVSVGEMVAIGQAIGFESNHGYTMDRWGNLCTGRDCGYHTHLNVFDKQAGDNVDPLTLIPASMP
jgi:murein DD-endopeptidase MepM/ murein hydrolase activator NlpD